MQRVRRGPVASRGLLALATSVLLALGSLLVPTGAAFGAKLGASPGGASSPARQVGAPSAHASLTLVRGQRATSKSPASTLSISSISSAISTAARPSTTAGQGDHLPMAGPGPLHLAATPPSRAGLDVRAPRAGPPAHATHVLRARSASPTSSRAPPTGH